MNLHPNILSDYLSPMLVKELRQELRTRSFVNSFLWVHGFLVLSLVLSLFLNAASPKEDIGKYLFWLAITPPLLIGIPGTGAKILDKEVKTNAMELLFLTDLSSWNIVFGKWLALVLESSLIVVSILPYAILRYFLGQVDLLMDISVIALLSLTSLLLISVRIGMATSRIKTKKSGGMGTIGTIGLFLIGGYPLMWGSAMLGKIVIGTANFIIILVIGSLLILYFLEFGASNIAPRNENHALRQRLFGLGVLLGAAITIFSGYLSTMSQAMVLWPTALVLIATCIGALVEETSPYHTIYQPFVSCGALGKLAGRLFYPGWATGSLYTLLILVLLYGFWLCQRTWLGGSWDANTVVVLFVVPLIGGIFFPIALMKLLIPKTEKPLTWYLGIQLAIAIGTFMGKIWAMSIADDHLLFSSLVPMAFLYNTSLKSLSGITVQTKDFYEHAMLADISSGICLLIVFWKAWPEFKRIRQLEKQVELTLRRIARRQYDTPVHLP